MSICVQICPYNTTGSRAHTVSRLPIAMVVEKRKGDLSDSDEDFDPSSEAAPASAEKPPKKKAKPKREPEGGDDGTSPKKKKKVDADDRYGFDLTEFDQSPELTAKYDAMSTMELSQWLKANRVVIPANKAHKVARCVDGELWGAIPPCPRCHVGRLKVRYESPEAHGGQGEWTCGGSFDDSINMRVKCYFTAKPGEVERLPWRDLHDPYPEPRPAAADAAAEANAEFPSGFASFEAPKAAAAIKAIALKLGFQLPAGNINSDIGAKLNFTRKAEGVWDGPAALAALREAYPPMTAEEKAGGPPARCEENSALASCLDALARLETKAKTDAFKIRAYKSAAMEIRALDYAVTSGKLAAKAGPTKVKGVGKGLGEKIDEFLRTGTMSRIAELEGQFESLAA